MENNHENCQCWNKIYLDFVNKIVEIKKQGGTKLMALQLAQSMYSFLAKEAITAIAHIFETTTSDVYSTASFYSQFKFVKQGKYRISLCTGAACCAKGADKLLAKFEQVLNIKLGETTPDDKFTLDNTRCVGRCGLAPVILINDKIYPSISLNNIEKIIKEYEGL